MKSFIVFLCISTLALAVASAELSIRESDTQITISRDGQTVLVYHKALMPPPEGQPAYFKRSGFIHPIHAPSGGVVTGIHPSDHIHHMGLWHAWVNTMHNGRKLDFWNLKEEQATIRYAETLKVVEGNNRVGFVVRQHHVALAKDGMPEEVILEEDFTISVRFRQGAYLIDHKTVQTNVTEYPLEFPAYRYGGPLAYRSPFNWDKENSDYLTSEGMDRTNGHETRGRWCAMYGPTELGDATVIIMGHPNNHDAPQRMRIWPTGKIFFNYVPIQEYPWSLEPGKPSEMNFRIIVVDGKPDKQKIERAWNSYAKR
ncbi:MAG: PmoA family protein [Verrucomicrobia bacterium]|nr:PmoA family protein [Verrucomicrobiota bacterium]